MLFSDPSYGQPDSGIVSEDIIDDISQLGPPRPPPSGHDLEKGTSRYHLNNHRYHGIQFDRGAPQVSTTSATIQLTPGGPVRPVGRAIPYEYDDAAMNPVRKKDFNGVPMPLRDPTKEFDGPNRFPRHRRGDLLPYTNSTFGQPIEYESHRFGLTTALWPIENRDSKLSDFQPAMSTRDPAEVSRLYADPRRADLAYKLEDKRKWACPFRNSDQRQTKMTRTSKSRRGIQGKCVLRD